MQNDWVNVPDILHFGKKFQVMVWQFQQTTEAFEKLQQENLQMRQELYSKELLLANECRSSTDLRSRLKVAMETINRLEEEKMRERIDRSNVLIDYESALRERDSLSAVAICSQTELTTLKIKVETLQNLFSQASQRVENLELALLELKRDNERITTNIDVYIAKLTKEQKHLLENCKTIMLMNRRLQAFGLSFHAINKRNKIQIKNLQRKLLSSTTNNSQLFVTDEKLHPEIENLCFKVREMLEDLKFKIQNVAENKVLLDKVLEELSANKKNTDE